MTEQTVVKQNFFGKDNFQWWIGQVTDPETGKWGKTLQTQKVENGNEVYYYRTRVRIIGYHDDATDLPDDKLPFAHVLGPANQTSGIDGEGSLLGLKGGEIVLGFFLDGEDGQQPVVFGTLYRNRNVKSIPVDQRKTAFDPFTPKTASAGKHAIDEKAKETGDPVSGVPNDESTDEITQAKTDFNTLTDVTITPPNPCGDSGIGEISTMLNDFSKTLSRLQNLDGQYIDPIMGKIIDIENEVKSIAGSIFARVSEWIRKIRDKVMKLIYEALDLLIKTIFPKPQQPYGGQAQKSITDSIFCLFENLLKDVFDYLFDSIMSFVDEVVSFTECVVSSFMGDMFSQLNSIIDTLMGPLLSAAGVAGSIDSIIGDAMSALGFLSDLFNCDKVDCREPHSWSTRYGTAKMLVDNFEDLFSSNPLDVGNGGGTGFNPPSIGSPNCSLSTIQELTPDVQFIGSSNQPASAVAMVDDNGEIVGVAITDSGSYNDGEVPIISFVDKSTPSTSGYGAGGVAIMGPVSLSDGGIYKSDPNGKQTGVVDVAIISGGGGYYQSDTIWNKGQEKPNTGKKVIDDYKCEISKIIVLDTGWGYSPNTTVSVGSCTFPVKLTSKGNIVQVFVTKTKCGLDCKRRPIAKINSAKGVGAKLKVVMKYEKIDPTKPISTTDGSVEVVSVVDCIGK